MATGLIKKNSVVAVVEEVTEGTAVSPASATDGYIQPLDGFSAVPARELLDREILTSSVGKVTPRLGVASASGTLPVEFRASGTEGGTPDFGLLLESALGATRAITVNVTTKASGNTTSVLQIEDADIGNFNVGDIVVVKEAGDHWHSPIVAVDTTASAANITLLRVRGSAFSNSVVVSKAKMYYTANSGHKSFSTHIWHANEIKATTAGCKINSLSLDNFTTGQLASLNFGFDALSYVEVDGAAPHTPSYDSGLPPVILSACLYQDGVEVEINNFGLSLSNTLSFITATCNENGRSSSRVTERSLTGSLDPFKDDTSVANYTKFNALTEFSLFVSAYIPSSTTGEITMGSAVGIYLPKCIITEYSAGDLDGILTDQLSFTASRGTSGATEEMYLGFV